MIVSNVLAAVLLFGMPGGSEWIFIILAIVLLFGGKKIPELMKGIGKGIREFNDAKESVKSEIEQAIVDLNHIAFMIMFLAMFVSFLCIWLIISSP